MPSNAILMFLVPFLLIGCVVEREFDGFKATSLTAISNTSAEAIEAATSRCNALLKADGLNPIRDKIPLSSTAIPTKAMLSLNQGPTDEELDALQLFEETRTTCQSGLREAGHTTTANEDIMSARLSRLRYGLFRGEIPYAVYNYGLASALRETVIYEEEAARAYAQGEEIGRKALAAHMQQLNTQMQMNSLRNQLNSYNTLSTKTWTCTSFGSGTYSCR